MCTRVGAVEREVCKDLVLRMDDFFLRTISLLDYYVLYGLRGGDCLAQPLHCSRALMF